MQINKTVALDHVDGDEQLLAELAAMFLEDYPRLMGELKDSINKGDDVIAERTAHTLKGRLAFFGMETERERALQLELLGRQRELTESLRLLSNLENEINSAMPELQALADISRRDS